MSPDRWCPWLGYVMRLYQDHEAMARQQAESWSDGLAWTILVLLAGAWLGALVQAGWRTWMRRA